MTQQTTELFAADRPLPSPDAATTPYWDAAREGRLVMPRCEDCGRYHFYPRTLCPHCSSPKLKWTDVSGDGEVYSFTVIHRAPSPAFATAVPYVVASVKLAEGPHLMTNVIGVAPEAVRVGMPVKAIFQKFSEQITLPMFQPAGKS
ncbi:MAG: putative nucleic-acid-binding protein containing a Zn-ribbon [Betaproteobacteria bacterium]|nr:putative nucleic-acid-binding protein containing a Zn-ribbon [Betaproteobacteria bacterium]